MGNEGKAKGKKQRNRGKRQQQAAEVDPNEIALNVETLSKFSHLGVKAPLKKEDCEGIIKDLEAKKEWYDKKGAEELENDVDLYYDARRGEFRPNRKREEGDAPEGDKPAKRGGKKKMEFKEDTQEWPSMQ
jgi:hypothetical protein